MSSENNNVHESQIYGKESNQTDEDQSDDRRKDSSSRRKKVKLANNTNNHMGKTNTHECNTKTKSSTKKLSLFQCIEDSDDSEGPGTDAAMDEAAGKSGVIDGCNKNQIKVTGHKAASVPESDRENDDASSTSSCSCEDHSSVESQSDDDPHGDLDYDEDSITNSPAHPSNGSKTINDEPSVVPPKVFDETDQEVKVGINNMPPDHVSNSVLNLAEKEGDPDRDRSAPHRNSPGDNDKLPEDDKKGGQRIKSFINFDHQADEDEVRPELLNSTKKTSKDRSHKSYEGLLKYFFKDACYFQIKSINHENVEISKRLGIWSTLVQNEIRFNTAFREHRNIILIFSVQQSGAFQGFARMISESEPARGPLPWVLPPRLGNVKLGGMFKVEWLCTKELPFQETTDLFNLLNDNKPIKVARDGQQVESKVGKKLCQLFPRDSKKRLLSAIETLKRRKDRANQRNQDVYPFNDALTHNPIHHNTDPYYNTSRPMGEMAKNFNGRIALPPAGHYNPVYQSTTYRARRHMTGHAGGPFLYPPNDFYATSRTAELRRNGYHHHVPPTRPLNNHPLMMEPMFPNHHQRVEYGMDEHMGGINHHHYPHPPIIDDWVPDIEMQRYHGNPRFRR